MRYMLMMHAPRGTGEYQVNSWSEEDLKAHIGFMHELNRDLTDAGERERAVAHYRAAAERTTSIPERDYLVARAARLSSA